ncbi:hypothetical protein ACTXT7_013571 [Hymenolepis weldensis]
MSEIDSVKVPSLEELCVKVVVEHFDSLITKCSDCAEPKFIWRFLHPNYQIPSRMTSMILKELGERKIFKCEYMTLFSKQFVNLYSLTLRDVDLTPSSVTVFRDFTLYNISAINVSGISLNDFTNSLRDETINNLHTLKLEKMFIEKKTKSPAITALGRLQNLIYFNISYTSLDSNDLRQLVKPLHRLQYLDISKTKVTDISCLLELRNNLKGLILHNLRLSRKRFVKRILSTILKLEELRVLDVSFLYDGMYSRLHSVDQLIGTGSLPHLQHLEMGNNPFELTIEEIKALIRNKSELKFLGFHIYAGDSLYENQAIEELSKNYPNIEICGGVSEGKIIKMLKYYKDRSKFLKSLFSAVDDAARQGEYFSPGFFKFLVEFLEGIVEKTGEMHSLGIHAAWAVTRGEQLHAIPTEFLQRMLHYALTMLEKAPLGPDDKEGEIDADISSCVDEENIETESDTDDFDYGDGIEDEADDSDVEEDETVFVDDGTGNFDGINNEEENGDDHVEDYSALNYYSISSALNFLKRILSIDTVTIDYIRCCEALFRVIKYVCTPRTRAFALTRLRDILERMSERELDEISTNPSYMQSLIKSAAEINVLKYHMNDFLNEKKDDKFSYLRNFWELEGQNVDTLGVIKKLLTNRPQACENFISVGGLEVWTFILVFLLDVSKSPTPIVNMQARSAPETSTIIQITCYQSGGALTSYISCKKKTFIDAIMYRQVYCNRVATITQMSEEDSTRRGKAMPTFSLSTDSNPLESSDI